MRSIRNSPRNLERVEQIELGTGNYQDAVPLFGEEMGKGGRDTIYYFIKIS
jgi:hypothetical protein